MNVHEQNRRSLVRIFMAAGATVLTLTAIFLAARILVNTAFARELENGTPSPAAEEALTIINFPEPYVPLYNAGNAYYKLEDYDMAIDRYQRALEHHPKDGKECPIRVNLALAMVHKIDFDHLDSEKKIDKAIQQLRSARLVLTEEGCAAPEGPDGHDPEAQKLREEIDELIKQLEQMKQNQDSDGDEDEQQQQQQQQDQQQSDRSKSNREREIERRLKEQKQQSMQEQQDAQTEKERREGGQGSDGYEYGDKNW